VAGAVAVVAPLVAAAPLVGGAAHAQVPAAAGAVAVDVGLTRIRQAGTAPLVAPSVGASWRGRRGRGTVGTAAVAAAGDGRVAAQLAVDGAHAFGPARARREVTAELRGVRVPNTPWAAQLLAGARQHASWRAGGGWVGAHGGVARQVARAWPSAGVEAGMWTDLAGRGRLALAASMVGARVEERGLVAAGVDAYGPARVRTGDLTASYVRAAGRVEVAAWAGGRAFAPRGLRALPADDQDPSRPGPPLRWRGLAAAAVTAWLAPAVGITVNAGTLPNDPVRGLPAARHLALALRVRPWTPTSPGAPRPALRMDELRIDELRVDALRPDERRVVDTPLDAVPVDAAPAVVGEPRRAVRVVAPGARRVELRADATGWRAVALARGAGAEWTVALVLAPGTHRVLVRVDDGPWRPPTNLPAVDDEMGGRVGLLVVP
jgi:hypothetical protein